MRLVHGPSMTDDLLLGLDLGATSARAVLTGRDGRILAAHAADYPMDTPRPCLKLSRE